VNFNSQQTANRFNVSTFNASTKNNIHTKLVNCLRIIIYCDSQHYFKRTVQMKLILIASIYIISLGSVSALSQPRVKIPNAGTVFYSQTSITLKQKMRSKALCSRKRDKTKCEICPEPEIDIEMDSREAAFAMMGQLWATTTGEFLS